MTNRDWVLGKKTEKNILSPTVCRRPLTPRPSGWERVSPSWTPTSVEKRGCWSWETYDNLEFTRSLGEFRDVDGSRSIDREWAGGARNFFFCSVSRALFVLGSEGVCQWRARFPFLPTAYRKGKGCRHHAVLFAYALLLDWTCGITRGLMTLISYFFLKRPRNIRVYVCYAQGGRVITCTVRFALHVLDCGLGTAMSGPV